MKKRKSTHVIFEAFTSEDVREEAGGVLHAHILLIDHFGAIAVVHRAHILERGQMEQKNHL